MQLLVKNKVQTYRRSARNVFLFLNCQRNGWSHGSFHSAITARWKVIWLPEEVNYNFPSVTSNADQLPSTEILIQGLINICNDLKTGWEELSKLDSLKYWSNSEHFNNKLISTVQLASSWPNKRQTRELVIASLVGSSTNFNGKLKFPKDLLVTKVNFVGQESFPPSSQMTRTSTHLIIPIDSQWQFVIKEVRRDKEAAEISEKWYVVVEWWSRIERKNFSLISFIRQRREMCVVCQ